VNSILRRGGTRTETKGRVRGELQTERVRCAACGGEGRVLATEPNSIPSGKNRREVGGSR